MFAARLNLEILSKCEEWFVDGTSTTSPMIFTQIFMILGSVLSVVNDPNPVKVLLPLVYALLTSQKEVEYKTVFHAVNSAEDEYGIEDFEPTTIISDFEVATINVAILGFSKRFCVINEMNIIKGNDENSSQILFIINKVYFSSTLSLADIGFYVNDNNLLFITILYITVRILKLSSKLQKIPQID